MAKSLRSNTKKANNRRLKSNVFGPVESARAERLSEKLMELANQPKPQPDTEMKSDDAASDGAWWTPPPSFPILIDSDLVLRWYRLSEATSKRWR